MAKSSFVFMPLIAFMRTTARANRNFTRFEFAGKRRLPDLNYETVSFPNVFLKKITSFGFVHDLELTKKGTPRQFNRWGYISLNSGAYYRVAILTVRELQEKLGLRCQIDKKELLTAIRGGNPIIAYDWHMSIKRTDNK